MSTVGRILRVTGVYNRLVEHFVDRLIIPFGTAGQIGVQEARFLGSLVRGLTSSEPIIEIGTLFGRATRVLVENARPGQEVITVDSFFWNPMSLPPDLHRKITFTVLRDFVDNAHLRIADMDKRNFYDTWKGNAPALVFLDADHEYQATLEDITWARSVEAEIICGHDYCTGFPGVIQAVKESGGAQKIVNSLWVLSR